LCYIYICKHVKQQTEEKKMKKEIKTWSGKVLYSNMEVENFKELVTSAIEAGVDLTGADLRGVDLSGVDLSGKDLRGVVLFGADLTGADLRGAKWSSALLAGANLTGASL
jgi:uncharacterized protein YjbI with pentapeptide repeats